VSERPPHARSQDDQANLADLKETEEALIKARQALTRAMAGIGQRDREIFIFHVGFARGRLSRVSERILRPNPSLPANDDDAEDRGSEG
jgi:hypothetical protein